MPAAFARTWHPILYISQCESISKHTCTEVYSVLNRTTVIMSSLYMEQTTLQNRGQKDFKSQQLWTMAVKVLLG